MADNPENLKYTKEHEWIDPSTGKVGVTDYAQHSLTDIVFVELPEKGKRVEKSKALAVLESVKSASDIYAPVSGEIIEVNEALKDSPDKINNSPFEEGWIAQIKASDEKEFESLMDKAGYEEYLKTCGK
jgi:glycine cleavage system H protein